MSEAKAGKTVGHWDFGLTIAFLLPGFVVLWGMSRWSETIRSWLAPAQDSPITIGGVLFAVLTALCLGVGVSAVRYLVVDWFQYRVLRVGKPRFDFSKLASVLPAFEAVVENHYRYYQFYANTMVAVIIGYVLHAAKAREVRGCHLMLVLLVVVIFLFASRDCLKKYHDRGTKVLKGAGGVT